MVEFLRITGLSVKKRNIITIKADDTYSAVIIGLTPNTEYWYQARALNELGWTMGYIESFTTDAQGVIKPTSIEITPGYVYAKVGQKKTLLARVLPAIADNRDVYWISEDTSVATVNENGVVTAVTLANNHMGDYGDGAIKETLSLLTENNILYAGTGENIEEAYKAFRIEKDGISISIISVCENEFGIATKTKYGSAGYNPRRLSSQIKAEKEDADYVVVVFHGGNEFNPLPSPDTVDRYRMICDIGADAIIGGHTHCPQGFEIYNGKPIVYSMGNFLFKSSFSREENDSWYYGYISILEISDGISLSIIPYKFNIEADKIIVFKDEEKYKMLDYIEGLSEIIQNEYKLEKYFSGWAWNHKWCPELPWNCADRENYKVSPNYNLVYCESHLSQLKEVLKVYYNENEKEAEWYSKKIIELQKMPV